MWSALVGKKGPKERIEQQREIHKDSDLLLQVLDFMLAKRNTWELTADEFERISAIGRSVKGDAKEIRGAVVQALISMHQEFAADLDDIVSGRKRSTSGGTEQLKKHVEEDLLAGELLVSKSSGPDKSQGR